MDAIASLGMRFDSGGVTQTWQQLDRLTASSAAAQRQTEALTRASVASTAAAQARVAADTANYRQVLLDIDAERRLETARLAAQISDKGRADSLNRLAQLARDSVAAGQALATLERDLTVATDAHTNALQKNISAMAQVRSTQQASASAGAAAFQSGINSSLGVQTTFNTVGRAEDVAAYGAALDALRTKFNPLYAASKQYEAVLGEIAAAEQVGAISANERAAAEENARLAFERESIASNNAAKGFGAVGGSLANLSFQLNDIATGILSGQSPFQILAQQGGQVFQVWQMNNNVFSELATGIGKLITPATVLGVGIVGIGAGLAYVYSQSIQTEKGLEAALVGTGQTAGVTAQQLNAMASAAAASSKISIGSARSIAEAYASSGKITGDQIRQLTALTADYAYTTRQSSDDATKELVGAFSDLSSGIDTLSKRLGTLTFAQRTYIENLIASGSNNKAVQATIDAMQPTLAHHADQLTVIGRLWAEIKANASGSAAAMDAASSSDTAQQLADARARLAELQQGQNSVQTDFGSVNIGVSGSTLANQQALVARLTAQLAAERAKNSAVGAASAANQISNVASPLVASVTPGFTDIQTLTNQRNATTALLANNQALKDSGFTLAQVSAAQEAYNFAIESYITPAQRAAAQTQLDIQALNAKTPAEKAAVAAAQQRLNVTGQAITADQRDALATAASSDARAQATFQLTQQSKATQAAIDGNIALARAYAVSDAAAMAAQAHTQAVQENITDGVNIQVRQRQLLAQAVTSGVASMAGDIASQTRSAEVMKAANDNVASGALAYDRLNDYIQQHTALLQLQALRENAVLLGDQASIAVIDQKIASLDKLTKSQQDNADSSARLALLNPNAQDIRNIQGLQRVPGGQTAIAGTALRQSQTSLFSTLGQDNPFGASGQLGLTGNIQSVRDNAAQQQKIVEDAAKAGLVSAQQAADARVAIEQDATDKIREAYTNLTTAQMQLGQQTFGSLADGVGDLVGKQSAAYKALFATEKAFAIASATINMWRSISEASALPFPANLPAIAEAAAQAGTILSSISAISGFQGGGYTGDGPVNGVAGVVHFQEVVTKASAVPGNRNTLAAMAAGANFDQGGLGGAGMRVEVIHDGSTGIRVQQMTDGRVRILARQAVADAKDGIVGEAVATSAKLAPNWVAQSNRRPRRRANVPG